MWLGSNKSSSNKPISIKCKNFINNLCIYIGYDKQDTVNKTFNEKIKTITPKLSTWDKSHLSLTGKILVIEFHHFAV